MTPASDQGSLTDRYNLIPRTLIFITRADHLLLIKGSPDKRLWPNQYNGIGGHIEQGEDILSAANRELLEETSLFVPGLALCGVITIDTGSETGIAIYIFKGESSGGDPVNSKEGGLEWVPIKDLYQKPLVEDLYTLLPHILNVSSAKPPIIGHYFYDDRGKMQIKINSSM